jgi:alpha-beta hydrolase superfamily lysophospholipase
MHLQEKMQVANLLNYPAGLHIMNPAELIAGKVIILVHGFSVPYYIWDGTYDSLVKAGFHVIRYDEFGRGIF